MSTRIARITPVPRHATHVKVEQAGVAVVTAPVSVSGRHAVHQFRLSPGRYVVSAPREAAGRNLALTAGQTTIAELHARCMQAPPFHV